MSKTAPRDAYYQLRQQDPDFARLTARWEGLPWMAKHPGTESRVAEDGLELRAFFYDYAEGGDACVHIYREDGSFKEYSE